MRNAEVELESLAVHQTVVVPASRLPPLFILAVPKHDVAAEDQHICDTIADLLDSAGPPMTLERWLGILRQVEPDWHELAYWWEEVWRFWPPLRRHPRYRDLFRKEIHGLISRLSAHTETPQFARGLLEGLLSWPDLPLLLPLFGRRPFPFPLWPSPVSVIAEAVYAKRDQLELSEGEASSWALITGVLASEKSRRVRATLDSISDFDVPFATSRRSDKTALSSIISEARMVAFFPIAHGAVGSAHHIIQGSYVVGLEIAAVSGAATLILVATYSLAEHLLRLGRQKRRRRQ